MKKTLATVVSGAVLLSGAAVTMASALEAGAQADIEVGVGAETSGSRGQNDEHRGEKSEQASVGMEVKASPTAKVEDEHDEDSDDDSVRRNATNSVAREHQDDDKGERKEDKDHATSTDDSEDEEDDLTPGEHRSKVAEFVKHLLEIADHDRDGLGVEVRTVAQVQDDSASTTAEAMVHVESRNPILVFLIGSDYKNLGKIRSEIATTDNSIARLKSAADKTTDTAAKADLQAQISVLETSKTELDAYVEAHESSFSLFGWAVKLFGFDK